MSENRKREQIQLRHLAVKGGPPGDCVVSWYGAMRRNIRDKTLPQVVVRFRKLHPDGTAGLSFRREVGITELALLQVGTIWNEGICRSQLLLDEKVVSLDYSPGKWRYASQASVARTRQAELIPTSVYPLHHGLNDRSEMLVFDRPDGGQLIVPSLEFFSRCYGRSAEVNRVLTTYGWNEAESRLYLPHSHPVPPKVWSVNLPPKIYNSDALFLAHVKYDSYAKAAAKSIYSNLEVQFGSPGGLAFPRIGPWFVGPAQLIVQGIQLDQDRFLALRIVGGTEPKGPQIWSFREENPGEANEPAPEGAPQSSWTGGRDRRPDHIRPLVNLTPQDLAGHDGNIVEVRNPAFRVIGPRRDVSPQTLPNAKTRPGPPIPNDESDKHSPGERQESGGVTGVASIHTETELEPRGAARDVWDALLYLHEQMPELITEVGWYSPQADAINFKDREPCMVALSPFDQAKKTALVQTASTWVYIDSEQSRVRGVLIAFVRTPGRAAYIFEIERRTGQHVAEDGRTYAKEQAFCGLIVSPPAGIKPSEWIPQVLEGIRSKQGIMARVIQYCPGHLVDYYRRSSSKGDAIAGHSTVVSALSKINIVAPHPKANPKLRKSRAGERSASASS